MAYKLNTLLEAELQDSFSIDHWNNKTFDVATSIRLKYNRIFFVHKGAGTLQIDDRAFSISGNELFLLAQGQIFHFEPGSQVTGYELCFGDFFWERSPASASNCKSVLFNNAAENQSLPLNKKDFSEIYPLVKAVHEEYLKPDYINKPDALAAYLKIIMIKMANINAALTKGFDSYENKIYRRFKELISTNYQQSHEVADYAAQLGITARRLTEVCKRCSGKGAKDLINGQIIAEAKRSLQFSADPIKEIAFHLKFSTPEQFSHFFKKNAAVSPQEYRSGFVNIGM